MEKTETPIADMQPTTSFELDPEYAINKDEIEAALKSFKAKIKLQNEPLADTTKLLKLLQQAAINQKRLFEGNESFEKYFMKEVVPGFVKTLALSIKIAAKDQKFLGLVKQIPEALAHILVNNMGDAELWDGVAKFFDHKNRIFTYHFLTEENAILQQNSAELFPADEKAWREGLKAGDELDAIKLDLDGKKQMWSKATVKERKNDNVVVSFFKDWVTSERELNIYSMNIAQLNSKSEEEFEWRQNLKAGELFDCWDSTGAWYACTVLQIQDKEHQGLQTTMVHVAYRVYRDDGDKSDDKGKYFGWEPEYDEWIHLYSPKLAKYMTHTDGTLQSQSKEAQENSGKKTTTTSEETKFDDSMDLTVLNDSQGNRIYAVQRKECKSDMINEFLNTFGRLGGFDLMLKRMREVNQDQMELYLVSSYIESVASAGPLFHKQFVNEYFDQFLQAVKQSLLGSSKAQLRLLKYDKINKIVEILFQKFVNRFEGMTPRKQKNLMFEFQVDLGIHFLHQDFLEKRIDGVKIIGSACNDCLNELKSTEKGQPTAKVTQNAERLEPALELVKKLLDKDFILEELFSSNKTHTQLVQRSEKVLRLLFGLEALSESQLDYIWKTTDQNDVFLETDILKALVGAAQDMSVRDMSFFINRIQNIKVENLSERYLQLIIEMGSMKHVETEETIQNQILNMLWSITFESEGKTNLMVVNSSSLAFSKRIRSLFFDDQLNFMYRLVDKLKENQNGYLVLKTLNGILRNSCDPPAKHPEYQSLTDVINHLESKKGLLEIIFDNFKFYMKKINEMIKNKEVEEKNLESQVIWDLFMHSDQITQRLEFIKFYVQKSPQVMLMCSHLESLWDMLIINSQVSNDQKQMMQWLREITDQVERLNQKKERQPFVSIEEITKFYHSRIASLEGKSDETFKNMNIEGFQCRQSFFVLVNSIQGRLRKVNWESGMFKKEEGDQSQATGTFKEKATKSFTSYNNETGAMYSSYSFNNTTSDGGTQTGGTQTGGTQTGPMIGPQKPVHQQQKELLDKDKDEDPDDLEVESVVSPGELDGMNMLWMIATESTSKNVIDAAAKLLISLHHGVARDLKERIPEFDDLFINKIFDIIQDQLPEIQNRSQEETDKYLAEQATLSPYATTIQQLRVMPLPERKIVRSLFLLRQMVRASEKDGTYGLRPHSALNKGIQLPNIQVANSFSGFQNKHHRNRFEISIDSNCTVWELKKIIGQELIKTSKDDGKTWDAYPLEGEKEPPLPLHPAQIRLFQLQTSKDIQDVNHGSTLAELNLKTNENLGVFKKSVQLQRKAPIVKKFEDGTYGLTLRATQIADEAFQKFSITNEKGEQIIDTKQLILYTSACTNTSCDEKDYRVTNFMQKYDKDNKGFVYLEEFMKFFIDSVTGGNELALRNNFENLGYGPNLEKLPVSGDEDNILQVRRSAKEMPRFKVSQNQKQFGILMQLMSIGGEVSKRAAEALNSYVTNPVLFKEVLKIESDSSQEQEYDWGTIFDKSNVHQMIYSLEIIQALLVGQNDKDRIKKFILSFVGKGGLKQLQQRLTEGLEGISKDNSFYQKMYLDRLLQLIKIFVSSGKVAEEKPQEFDLELKEEEDPAFTTPTKPINRAKIASGEIEVTQQALFGDEGVKNDEELEMEQINKQQEKETQQKSEALKRAESIHLSKVLSSQDIIESISSKIDLHLLKQQSIKLMDLFIVAKDFDSKDRPIVETSLQLWQKIESEDSEDKPVDISSSLLTRGLIKIQDKKIREVFRDSLLSIAKVKPSLKGFLVTFINETLGTLVNKASDVGSSTGQFFDLIGKLLETTEEPSQAVLDRYQLLGVLVQLLKKYEAKETVKSLLSDQTLHGSLETISNIIVELKKKAPADTKLLELIEQTDLVNVLLYRCLFFQEGKSEKYINTETQKAKSQCASKDCRKAGFKVMKAIVSIMQPKEMNDFITTHIMPILNEVQRPSRWRHLPSSQNRENGYCGIVNLGCICYMISILQQFYMVPQFRYQVMKAEDKTPENIGEFKDEKFDDNLLKQLQTLYGYLELSERQAASAKGMCFSYKDFDGLPTKIGEQKDSQEFLNFFVDRIEEQLKPTTQKNLINDIFRGTQCDQIICQSCGRIRNKIDQFCNLSLEVQGMKGVYQSLDHMKKGEVLEGYHCEGCDQRVNATKRQIIGKTPNMLILHLKRFVFSFETYENEKINSHFEFPKVLDLKQYSVKENIDETEDQDIKNLQQLEDDEFIYRLVGINIQEGSATSGHYYSFINTLRGDLEHDPYIDEEKWQKVNLNPWREFNDSKISIFNFERDVEKEAFGGESSKDLNVGSTLTDDELGKFLSLGSGGYGKSAYMLFYERKKKSNLTEFTDESQETTQIVDYKKVPKVVPDWISDIVKKDNKSFLVDSQVFDEQFFDFMKELFKTIQDLLMSSHTFSWPYNRENYPLLKNLSVELLGKTVFDMLCYYDRNIVLQSVINSASSIMTFCDSTFYLKEGIGSAVINFIKKFFIDDMGAHFFKIMFNCTDINSRNNAGKLLATAITRAIKLYDEFSEEDKPKEAFQEVKSVIDKSLDLIFGAFKTKECMKAWTKLEAYFDMILEIGKSCFTAKQILLDRSDIISEMIDFILGNKSPRAAYETEKRPTMGGVAQPAFSPLFNFISLMVRMVYTSQMDTTERLPSHYQIMDIDTKYNSAKTYFLTDEAVIMLTKTDFLERVIMETKYTECEEFAQALCHLCYRNLSLTRKVCKRFLKALSYSNNDQAERHLILLVALLQVQDQYQIHRLEYLFGFPFLMKGGDQPFYISTGLDARQYDDAVLNLLWKYKGRLQSFSLTILEKFGEIIISDPAIYQYMAKLPSLNSMVNKYTDWIIPFLEEQTESTKKYSAGSGTEEKLTKITLIQCKFEEYFSRAEDPENKIPDNLFWALHSSEEMETVRSETVDDALEITIKRVQGTFAFQDVPQESEVTNADESNPQPEQKGPQEQVQTFECADLCYHVYAKNLKQANLKVKYAFQEVGEEESDLVYPVGGIKDFLKPNAEVLVFTLRRRYPDRNLPAQIDKIKLNVKWKNYNEDDFTMGNYATISASSVTVKNTQATTATTSTSNTNQTKDSVTGRRGGILLGPVFDKQNEEGTKHEAGNSPINFMDEYAAAENEAKKSCPACTLDNPISATNCSLCEQLL